jgi:phosphoribosylanthranilate isomerase
MWIKICGLTQASAVSAALAAGVDALGFVFARSVRQLTPTAARTLAGPARARARCVAVTLHPTQAEVDEILREFRPDVLQGDAGDLAALRLPDLLERLPVVRGAPLPVPLPPRLLFEGPRSGLGLSADWDAARGLAGRAELVLAGGLNPDNVAAAIRTVRPFGVDVSSGVEAQPGRKDIEQIDRFVTCARTAARANPMTREEAR